MANENYLILKPTLDTIVAQNTQLAADLKKLAGKYSLEVGLKLSSNALKEIDQQIKSQIGNTNNLAVIEDRLNDSYKKQNLELQKRVELLEKAKKSSSSSAQMSPVSDHTSIEKTKNDYEILLARLEKMKITWSALGSDPGLSLRLETLKTQINESMGDTSKIAKYRKEVQLLSGDISAAGLAQKSFADKIAETGERLSAYLVSMATYTLLISGIKNALEAVKEIDLSLTEIRKVSDLAGSSLDRFVDRAFDAASQIGRTGKDLIDATAEFRRAGYELESSFEMGQAALIMTNVGDGIKDVEQASSALIATLRGFKISETEVMSVVDKLNEVDLLAS